MACDSCNDANINITSCSDCSNGNSGGYCLKWKFDGSTAAGPSSSYLRFNNGTYSSVTTLYISDTDFNTNNAQAFLDTFDDGGTSSNYGYVTITKEFDSTKFIMFKVTAIIDSGTYHTITATYLTGANTFSQNDNLIVCFTPTGTQGVQGSPGKGLSFSWVSDPNISYTAATVTNTYVTIAQIAFPGTNNIGTISSVIINAWTSNAANAASFKIIDATNGSITVCEQTGVVSTSTANIITPSTVALTNLPTGNAIFYVQAKNAAAADAARLAAVTFY